MRVDRGLGLGCAVLALAPSQAPAEEAWIARSNEYAQAALDIQAKYAPEFAATIGVEGYDEAVFDLRPGYVERSRRDLRDLIAQLEKGLATESDPRVRQDLEILIDAQRDQIHTSELNERYMLPYFDLGQAVFFGVQSLLDPQNAPERRPAVVTRLRRYAGLEPGYEPIVELAKAHTSAGLENPELVGPYVEELSQHVQNAPRFIEGMRGLLAESGIQEWQEPFAAFEEQLRAYYAWLDEAVRPRARREPRLPPEIYADNLKGFGVDVPPEELIERATLAFADLQGEMKALALLVAREKGYAATDYRDVIRELKQERVPGDEVVGFYKETLGELEAIIEREGLVTLPDRAADIQIASEARTAAQPAPHLNPPRLIGNTGEYPVFMIPTIGRNEDGSWQHNDTTFKANAWTLTAHEARPGHEMQFSSMIEAGVSTARAVFAFNSANVEGWGLYAEAITRPYMPLDGQLISLQNRLLRAARMFLDPMINLGQLTREEAKEILMTDVVLDDGFAQQEVDRYSFRAPGQATSYYFGYSHLQSLRTRVELRLRERFDQRVFHDFLLAQGLLPPAVLQRAVMEELVEPQLAAAHSAP
jgi:hypothetical protein